MAFGVALDRKFIVFCLVTQHLDGVVILYETIHELHSKKLNGVPFKIDFRKAYDNVNYSFLLQTIRMKGFSEEWRALIQSFVVGCSLAIKLNDGTSNYF